MVAVSSGIVNNSEICLVMWLWNLKEEDLGVMELVSIATVRLTGPCS